MFPVQIIQEEKKKTDCKQGSSFVIRK